MTTTSEFNLRAVIRQVLAGSPNPDPKALADEVAARIPAEEVGACLRTLLRPYIRVLSSGERRPDRDSKESAGERSSRWSDVAEFSNSIRTWRVPIGDDDWKFLGDLTAADCERIAEMYGDLAAANERRAKSYQLLADTMEAAAVQTAGELADDQLSEIFE